MNNKGQFSIIAAMLVAVILVATVIITYSTIRNSTIQNQSPILSAIDETNLAIRRVLGFTVGYYGSILQITGNSTYAKTLAANYLQSGLLNIANMHPQWGTSLNVSNSVLQTYWFTNTSYSGGNLTVNYDLAGLGIRGISYQTSCRLNVQIITSMNGQAYLNITKEENEPLITLGKQNFNFYRYINASSTWELVNPSTVPTAYANGTYQVDVPSGINPVSYVVQIEDQRGIVVVASSFNAYTSALTWNSTSVQIGSPSSQNYVNNYNSSIDSLPDQGTHSNFTLQKNTDNIYDNVTEANIPVISANVENFVDNNSSNVDGLPGHGTSSNFTAQQDADVAFNDTLTEADTGGAPLTITFVSAGAEAANSGAVTPALPASMVSGDICILVATTIAGGTIAITANGSITTWTAITGSPIDVTGGEKLYVWWGRWTSGTTGPTVTPASDHVEAGIGAWRNCVASGSPIDVSATGAETTVDTSFSFATSISTTVNGCMAIAICTTGEDIATNGRFTTMTDASLTSLAERMDYCTSSGSGGGFALDEGYKATAGAVGTWASTLTTASSKAYISFALRPALAANYELDYEFRWTTADNTTSNAYLCIRTDTYTGTAENLKVDWWNTTSSTWLNINSSLVASAWNNISISAYLNNPTITFRFLGASESSDTNRNTWKIECNLVHTWNSTNYRLDIEEQWTNANYTSAKLCIKTGSFSGAAEPIAIDVWNGSAWINVLGSLNASSWNNVTITAYLQPSNFTIRFKGTIETSDSVQDWWQIDAALLAVWPTSDLYSLSRQGTIVGELLQNGTMRWLGQNLIFSNSTSAVPFPPIPVKSIHVNETINGVNSEVPFQIEDWSSAYRIPLGLTSNASIFSSRTMLVFLATPNASKVTIWWNGSDIASQTSYAYTNNYFNDSPSSGRLSNGFTTLQFSSGFTVTSTAGTSLSTANFMRRINGQNSTYGSGLAYVITNGVVRDVVHQEAEWPNGVTNCSDIYSDIVLTLPANTTYYTYQLRLIFVQSQQNRTINDLGAVWMTPLNGQLQTENGTADGLPIVSNATDLFYNYSASSWAHHWSQSISGTKGAGIMFADSANQNLYIFDSITGIKTGGLNANSTVGTIQLLPVAKSQLNFNTTLDPRMQDIIWYGAVATFDATTPIYNNYDQTGLWMIVEYPPAVAVTTENYQ